MTLSHTLAVDDLLREVNTRLAQAAAAAGPSGGTADGHTGAYGRLPAPSVTSVSRSMLLNALRQLDDLVLLDETTNTVRPLAAAAPRAATA